MPESPELILPVELGERDVVTAHFWTVVQLPLVRILAGMNLFFFLAGALLVARALARGGELPVAPLVAAIAIAFAFAMGALQVRGRARAHFRALSDEERRGTYTFDDEGFGWTLGRSPGRAPWSAVSRSQETGAHVFLLTLSYRTHVLPKRNLGGPELTGLRHYLAGLAVGHPYKTSRSP